MPDKTTDIQDAIEIVLMPGPLTRDRLQQELLGSYPQLEGQQQWIQVALYRMLGDGRIRAIGCAADHNHVGDCTIALAD